MNRLHGLILAALFCLAQPIPAHALVVRDVLWGFDSHVVAGRFTPVWVLVENPEADAFQGTFTFQDNSFAEEGLPLESLPVFISPGGKRWVEFVPFIESGDEHWGLSWRGTQQDSVTFDPLPKLGPPACVLLEDSEAINSPAGIKTFPENRFPSSVTELDTLDSVVLDHMPRWQPLQSQALLDWLYKGGTLHLASDGNGRFPQFTDELTILNTPLDQFHAGAGLVIRHDLPRRLLTDKALLGTRSGAFPSAANPNPAFQISTIDHNLLLGLRNLTQPHHNWPLLYLLGIVYLLLIGPVNWRVGKRFRGYPVPVLFLLASIAVFASLFYLVGRRGDGESAVTYTLSEARPLTDGAYDVTQWSSIFVSSGGMYDITHASPHNLYAMPSDTSADVAQVLNGKDGHFLADIPLLSWRDFIHRGKMPGPPSFTARNERQNHQMGLPTLVTGGAFPKSPIGIWARYAGQWVEMAVTSNSRLLQGNPVTIDQNNPASFNKGNLGGPYAYGQNWEPDTTRNDPVAHQAWVDAKFHDLAEVLLARHTAGDTLTDTPEAHARLPTHIYVLERAPDSFNIVGNDLGREIGYVLIDQAVSPAEDNP